MPVSGDGRRKVLIVAEAPGRVEDEEGVQFIGNSGQHLRRCLRRIGVDVDRDCWKTNAVICRPPNNEVTSKHVECCRPNLLRTVEELEPEKIVLIGGSAVESLFGLRWRKGEPLGGIGRWVGWKIPDRRLNAWVCPTWHPAYLLREKDPVLQLWFDRHLEAAFKLEGRPWPGAERDLRKDVEVCFDADRAAALLDELVEQDSDLPVAFDYETNMLKPDGEDARIESCAVAMQFPEVGRPTALAFSWLEPAVGAMGRLLHGDCPKWGWNIKFEERWTRRAFGQGVRRWEWDGMQAAHALDNRPKITSCKFQAFVRLGIDPWDSAVRPLLEARRSNERNRIGEADMEQLLMYNGMDALCEWWLCDLQRREMEELSGA